MDSWTIINIVLNAITIFNSVLTAIMCIGILLIIIIFHLHRRSVPILLASYTCLAMLLSAIVLLSMITSSLFGFIGIHLYDHGNTVWCRCCGFLIHGFLCALYDTYSLQGIFRFFRVVFHRRQVLHSFNLYCIISPFGMVFSLMCISPVLFWNNVIYLPSEFFCQTPFTDLPAILYVAGRLYGFPLISLSAMYWYLVRCVRRISPLAETADVRRRCQNNARDMIVIKRLFITLMLLLLLGMPSIIFLIIFLFTGHLPSITYRIGWLSVSFSLVCLTFMLIKHTVPLRDTVKRLINKAGIRQRRVAPQRPIQIRNGTY
jgi:hypothetical protein